MPLQASKEVDSEFQTRLLSTLSSGEVPDMWCDFSPGPSWGFNGIQTVVLTNQNLRTYQRGFAITARRDATETATTVIPLVVLRSVTTKSRSGLLGRGAAFTMKVTWDGGKKMFTTKYSEGPEMARRLDQLIGKSRVETSATDSRAVAAQEISSIPVSEQLERLAALHGAGSLTDAEFRSAKSKLLS
jgi:hypothetical protein